MVSYSHGRVGLLLLLLLSMQLLDGPNGTPCCDLGWAQGVSVGRASLLFNLSPFLGVQNGDGCKNGFDDGIRQDLYGRRVREDLRRDRPSGTMCA